MPIASNQRRAVCIGDTIDIIAPIPYIEAWWEHLRHVTGFYWWKSAFHATGLARPFKYGEDRHNMLDSDYP